MGGRAGRGILNPQDLTELEIICPFLLSTGHANDMQMDCVLEEDGPPELIPNESDFLLGYATVPGFVSYRSKTRGSWYITKLTECLNKYAYE